MPNLDRLSSVAVVVLLAACDGLAPASPTSGATAASRGPASTAVAVSPASTPSVRPTILPAPTPLDGCIGLDDADPDGIEVELGFVEPNGNGGSGLNIGRVGGSLQVTRIEERSGRKRSATPPPRELDNGHGLLLGGVEFVTFPFTWFAGHRSPQSMIDATVSLALDGRAPTVLSTRFVPGNENFNQVAVTVPDRAGSGTLAFELVWTDRCYRYEASGTFAVDVVPRSRTEGCVLDWNAYYDEVGALLEGSVRVETSTPRAFSPVNRAKFGPWESPGIDEFLGYAFDKDEPAIVAAPGAVLRVEQTSKDLTLGREMSLLVWTRASIARAVKDYPPDGIVLVLSRTPEMQADGSFRLRVPTQPGRYVAGVELTYDSQCSSGTLWFTVNIDVVVP